MSQLLLIGFVANKPIPDCGSSEGLISILSKSESQQSYKPQRASLVVYCSFCIVQYLMGQFCYWEARSQGDSIFLAVFVVIEILIGSVTVHRLKQTRRLGEHGKKIIVIYLLVVAWCIVLCGQHVYSVLMYFLELKSSEHLVYQYSRNYVRFDILPGFIVQTIFLTICRFYYKGMMNAVEISRLSKWQRNYINYLNCYSIIRVIAQAGGLILVNIYALTDNISLYSQINLWILILDSVITNVYLGLSLKIYLHALTLINFKNQKSIKTLKLEYSFMIASSLIRVIIDVVFLVIPIATDSESNKKCMGSFQEHLLQSVFYGLLGNVLNHFLPIIWILKIYNFDNAREEDLLMSENLLSSSNS